MNKMSFEGMQRALQKKLAAINRMLVVVRRLSGDF